MKITAKVQTVFPIESIPTRTGGTFQKRVVWALDESNVQFPNPLEFEFSGNGLAAPDRLQPGMVVEFECAIQGNEWTTQAGKQGRSLRLRSWGANVVGMVQPQYNPQQPQPMLQPGPYQQPASPQPQPGAYQNVPANPYGGQPVVSAPGYGQQPQPQYQQPAPGFVPPLPQQPPNYNPQRNDLPF